MGKVYAMEDGIGWGMISHDDGSTWNYGDTEITHNISCVGWDGHNFCVMPKDTNISYITPDATYTTYGTLPVAGNWGSIAYGNTIFCSVLKDSTTAAISQDGITWQVVTLSSMGLSGDTWSKVIFSGGLFMIFGRDVGHDYIITAVSSDGVFWEDRREQPIFPYYSGDLHLNTYGNKVFVHSSNGEGGQYNSETRTNIFTNDINANNLSNRYTYSTVGKDVFVFAGSYNTPSKLENIFTSQLDNMPVTINISNNVLSESTFPGVVLNQLLFGVVWTGLYFLILTYAGVIRSLDGKSWELIDYSNNFDTYPWSTIVIVGAGTIELDPPAFWTDLYHTKQTF